MARKIDGATLAETLLAAAERIAQLPASVPPPHLSISEGYVHASWNKCSADAARAVLKAAPAGEWSDCKTYLYLWTEDDVIGMWFIYPAQSTPALVVSPAALLAEQVRS